MPTAELTQQQIDQLRDLLLDKRRELESQLASAEDTTKPVTLDQQSVGRVSRIDAIQQQQMAIAGQQQATQISKQIEVALQRIDSGEYGYCLQCGETIGFARLQAQPFASMCLDCQSASESG
ncbi:MAG: TraR/DksA family transcriptional regulator [Gammaproteobacteria bacterium]|nr:TraR/DksA family transcriptional regulator [Gammaproteobacteria bacterium]